jgi:cell filamentation protein
MNDSYVYEGTSVLINSAGIRDQAQLDEFEGVMVRAALEELFAKPFAIQGAEDIFVIHKALFSDVYSWAGQPRSINIYKAEPILNGLSVDYSDYRQIIDRVAGVSELMKSIEWGKLSKKEQMSKVGEVISTLWRIHPFREGNTRSVATFLYFYLKGLGLKLNEKFLGEHAKYFRNSLVLCSIDSYSEPEHLQEILFDAVSLRLPQGSETKYQTIRGYEVAKYAYQSHSIKKPVKKD